MKICSSILFAGIVIGLSGAVVAMESKNGWDDEDILIEEGTGSVPKKRTSDLSSGNPSVTSGSFSTAFTTVVQTAAWGLQQATDGAKRLYAYAQGEPLVPPDILQAPWNAEVAERFVGRFDYERLTEYLYTQIDIKKSPEAIRWVKEKAQIGIIPACYFDIRNTLHKFQSATANHDEIKALAFDVLRFLTLIQLDIATWCQVVGEAVEGQAKQVASVYFLFKTKFNAMIGKVPCLQGLVNVNFNEVLTAVKNWVNENKSNLQYHPCVWVVYCAQSQPSIPGRTRIFYGLPPEAALVAQMRDAQKTDVLQRQFGASSNLYGDVSSALSCYTSQETFLDFIHNTIEYPESFFRKLIEQR